MTFEPASIDSEKALRERIHRIFTGGDLCAGHREVSPHFWVEPSKEEKNKLVLEVHEPIGLTEELEIGTEERWLNTPHASLDGMSPEAMLNGDERSRQRLVIYIEALETAIAQGSFS